MGSEIHEGPFSDAHGITRTDSAGLLHEPPHIVVRVRCWCLGGGHRCSAAYLGEWAACESGAACGAQLSRCWAICARNSRAHAKSVHKTARRGAPVRITCGWWVGRAVCDHVTRNRYRPEERRVSRRQCRELLSDYRLRQREHHSTHQLPPPGGRCPVFD